ncbi:hypothetical protein BGZ91_001195 [Linnemannia elongata]|nr:hypothetical protein BGZ91_001195 [Linnemannia elongata]
MDRWDPIELTSTFRPVLEPQEAIQTTQDQVGLYDGRVKAEDYPNGTVYLTNYRILYIDAKDPARKSIGLALRLINGIQHYGGFMSSSPKITLDLYPRSANFDPQSSTDFISSHGGRGGAGLDPSVMAALTLKTEPSWVCTVCYNSNQGELTKCTVCGVRKPQGSMETPTTPAADPFHFVESIPSTTVNDAPRTTNEQPGIACPACTFHNDPFMIHCEICGTQLQDQDSMAFMLHRQQQHQRSISQLPSTLSQTSTSLSTTPTASDATAGKMTASGKFMAGMSNFYGGSKPTPEDANSVKLSFRAGGSGSFQTLLKSTMGNKAWENKPKARPVETARNQSSSTTIESGSPSPSIQVGGISGIMRTVESTKKVADETLSEAFRDLQGLMDKAAEMVALAETISNRLSKSSNVNNEETATFKTYLLSMGIAAPVTKDTAGAVFHKELARELVEFILPIVEREGGTMSLMDIYCVFNRARGVELISPKDLHTACELFEALNLPLRMRKFDSGLLVIQTLARYSDDEVSTAITSRIQNLPPGAGLTAVELASAIQISVALAQEQLLMTEARGLICRDESVEGLRFFDNLFAHWEI